MGRTRQDYYEVLGVPRTADDEAIKKAFHALARRFHPDVCSEPNAEERFREVATAYEVLSRPRSRTLYDHLSRGRGGHGERRSPGAASRLGSAAAFYPSSRESRSAQRRRRPSDVQVELTVDALTARRGAMRNLQVTTRRACDACGGLGAASWTSTDPCAVCVGTGSRPVQRTVRVRVAPGTSDGDSVRISGAGDADRIGGELGDALVVVRVADAPDLPLIRYASLAGLAVALGLLTVVLILL